MGHHRYYLVILLHCLWGLSGQAFAQCPTGSGQNCPTGGCDQGEAYALCELARPSYEAQYSCEQNTPRTFKCRDDPSVKRIILGNTNNTGSLISWTYGLKCSQRDEIKTGASHCEETPTGECKHCKNGCEYSERLLLCVGCSSGGQYAIGNKTTGNLCTIGEEDSEPQDPPADPPCTEVAGVQICITPDGVCKGSECVEIPPPGSCSDGGAICAGSPPPEPDGGGPGCEPGDDSCEEPPEPCGSTDAATENGTFDVDVYCDEGGGDDGGGDDGGGDDGGGGDNGGGGQSGCEGEDCDPGTGECTGPNCTPCTGEECGAGCQGPNCSGGGDDGGGDCQGEDCDDGGDCQGEECECEGEDCDDGGGDDGGGDDNGGGQASGGTTCDAPPSCSGNAVGCMTAYQAWRSACETEKLRQAFDGDAAEPLEGEAGDHYSEVTIDSSVLNTAGFLGGGSCPVGDFTLDLGVAQATVPAVWCEFLPWLGWLAVAIATVTAARIIGGA